MPSRTIGGFSAIATVTRGYTFGATETVTDTKLHTLVDSATVTAIVNADVDAAAAIAASKLNLATIAQAVTFSGKALSPSMQTLTDGATVALDASTGNVFKLVAGGSRTISVPTNGVNGQKMVIIHMASGADRTLTLTTGASGFRFGTDITALTATTSAKTDYIGCIYNSADSRWDVIAVVKGYA